MLKNSRIFINNKVSNIICSLLKSCQKKKIIIKLKRVLNIKNLILTNFGRSSLFFILKNLKRNNKDEILVCSYNYYEIINVIIYANLKPVFYDLENDSLNSNYVDILNKINDKTLGIIVTHFNGFDENTKKIKNLCSKKKIYLIEDCAIALNTNSKIKNVSYYGDYSFFSLNFTKNLSAITGGIIKSNKKNINELKKLITFSKYKFILNFSNYIILLILKLLNNKNFYFFLKFLIEKTNKPLRHFLNLFFKFKTEKTIPTYYLNELNYVNLNILENNIKNIKFQNEFRIRNNKYYFSNLKYKKNIINLIPVSNLNNITLEYPILFKSAQLKNKFLINVENLGLDCRKIYYTDCSNLKMFKNLKNGCLKNSKKIEKNIICLPNHPEINKKMILEFATLIN